MTGRIEFRLNPALRADRLHDEFACSGRLTIAGFLGADGAHQLRQHLLSSARWLLVLNAGDRTYELPSEGAAQLEDAQAKHLDTLVADAARWGFQYRYESIRASDDPAERAASDTPLDRFAAFMSSGSVVDFLGRVIGAGRIDFADAQATAYGPGHFLTRHDDDVSGKGRQAAYVLGLTPTWRAEWGGLLMFHRDDGDIDEAYTPAFNSLRLFRVPAVHSVSYVSPFAEGRRLSVTGWLRSRR